MWGISECLVQLPGGIKSVAEQYPCGTRFGNRMWLLTFPLLLTETKFESGDVSQQKRNFCELQVTVEHCVVSHERSQGWVCVDQDCIRRD